MSEAQERIWPRAIWAAELSKHANGQGDFVTSVHATLPRFEGDDKRNRAFHSYVDADILETSEKYWKERHATQAAEIAALQERVEALTGALAIEAAAIRIAKYQHPNSRWPKDEEDTISNRSGVYPVTWCFANKCRNIARAALTPEGEK